MVKTKILKIILLTLVLILIIFFSLFVFIKITFKKTYSNLINEELENITLNSNYLNKNLVLSVIKQESKFNEKAKSGKDAFGLMQLTFLTAKEVANNLGLEITISDLFNPEINIKLGVNYLNYLFTIFEDKQLVLMSYNAGFNKVKSWLKNGELKTINGVYVSPYNETNNYLNKVLQNEKIYNLIG